ncbi:Peroxisomal nicotinamide adenine dinucleotide carrier [Raphanus sativus]|uniref:Peroxisomal nicotinamide adenine dinucleotide carrier n=1 Tax=Raphanus sativus TaxID=3726 RepID=A0A6J0JJL6_RAPSA|nr:peroxisomal nicotinamide adenine dinucleotide carrier [Raphanus sativus]KAJ4892009.1 Peroxisomal nicotinamide adenine dinucleotide carrier [Raphanus sativus]
MSDALINGLAGAGGGIIAQLLTYPLQTVNTRQQTERDLKREKKKLGTFQHMCQVVKQEGWGRLYGGLAPSLVGTAASQGVYYYFYQVFRNQVEAAALRQKKKGLGDGSVGMFSSLLVAALAGSVNVLMTNPIWVIVTRMQTHKKIPKGLQTVPEPPSADVGALVPVEPRPYGTVNTIQEIYDEAGVTGFWKGVIPTLIMVCNPAMQFMLYETMLSKLKKKRALKGSTNVTALETFLLGAVAKLGATVTTYPLLVVKSRLQAKQVTTGDKRQHYKGTLDAILKMIRYEGLHGFYKGMSTKIVQSVFAAAVLFMIKEELVKGAKLLLSNATSSNVKSKPS